MTRRHPDVPVCEHRCSRCGERWFHTEPPGGCGLDDYARCLSCRADAPLSPERPLLERVAACSAGSYYDADTGWLVVWNGSQTFNVFDAEGVVHAFTAADHVVDPADAEAMAADWIAALRVERAS